MCRCENICVEAVYKLKQKCFRAGHSQSRKRTSPSPQKKLLCVGHFIAHLPVNLLLFYLCKECSKELQEYLTVRTMMVTIMTRKLMIELLLNPKVRTPSLMEMKPPTPEMPPAGIYTAHHVLMGGPSSLALGWLPLCLAVMLHV